MKIGYFLSCEEYTPAQLVDQAVRAERAGFEALWISDHFHPWNGEQGQSPFVWAVIGAISQVCRLPVTTAVTCPTVRLHPAIVAQAAATAQVQLEGRFRLGVGSGEALNEHVTASRWPSTDVRLEMLTDAVELIRELWTGEAVTRHGPHYAVEDARIYTRHEQPPPIYISGFGPKAAALAGRIGDGYIATASNADLIETFQANGGKGKPAAAGLKVCYAADPAAGAAAAHRLWPNESLPGELAQTLPSPAHFEQASTLVTSDMTADSIVCGPDVDRHVAQFEPLREAGFDEVYVAQIGGYSPGTEIEGFFEFYRRQVLPALAAHR